MCEATKSETERSHDRCKQLLTSVTFGENKSAEYLYYAKFSQNASIIFHGTHDMKYESALRFGW